MQIDLVSDDQDDAWDATIRFLGGYKKVACNLWPHLKQETAYNRLKHCFNDDKDERLSFNDAKRILQWARDAGCHLAMYRLCDDLLYERPNPASKERLTQEIKTQINLQTDKLHALLNRLDKLESE